MLNKLGKYTEVAPFTPDYESLHKVPIIDADIEYDDKYSGETHPLVFHGALVMPSMDHNLFSQFTLSEAVLKIMKTNRHS